MKLRQIIRFNLFCAALALCLAGAWLGVSRPVAGKAAQPVTLHGAAALERLKQDGQYDSLRAALNQARFGGSHTAQTPLGRAAWRAHNPAAGYQVVIEAEDRDAAYPLTINPLFMFQQRLTAADGQARDRFGAAVALSGDTVVIGAPMNDATQWDQGSVYVFVRSGGFWTQLPKLTASDGATGDSFGAAVALSGDTLVVGAPFGAVGSNVQQGSVYVFTRNGGFWNEQQKLTASDGAAFDEFGCAVALSSDTLVVGAHRDANGSNVEQGSAYVFVRSGATQPVWTQQQKLTASDGAAGDSFGAAVALDGDMLVASAPFDDIGANPNQGSAYVFTRSGAVWTLQQKLSASDGAADDSFGFAVALSGDKLAVGAPYDAVNFNYQQGSVYAFGRNGTVWTQRQKLSADDGMGEDRFGSAVAMGGDTLVVGAPNDVTGPGVELGSASVFAFTGSWVPQETLTTASGASNEMFGHAVALSNDTVMAGAPGHENLTQLNRGSVYAFVRPACPTLTLAPASLPNGASGAAFQQQITVSGGAGPFQFWLSGGALPPGLTLAQNGLLSGTPTTQGIYQFTIRATDLSSFCSGGHAYTLTIAPPCSNLRVNPPSLPKGKTGMAYSETLTAKNGAAPYQFSVVGSLPPGLSLSAGGVLSGTPTQAGNFSFTVLARDANGCAGSRGYTLTIN
ncbi:MAG: putative Ig domain-containing protein [Blastocatellia bacterium]